MKRLLVTVVSVGALTFSVYLAVGGDVSAQKDFLVDAGYAPSHVATCPVRISPECVALAADAGVTVHTYERLSFGVDVNVMADGGRDVQLPPMAMAARECIQPDWPNCTLALCATRPTVCAKVGQPLPFVLEARSGRCLRKNTDAGFPDCFTSDGGDPGDMNVHAAAFFSGTCEPVEASGPSCAVVAGENPNVEL
jgi:hypothetical protein